MTAWMKAQKFAVEKHGNQMYGDEPYIYHLQAVHHMVIELSDFNGADEVEECVALLHDVIEDTECKYGDLFNEFNFDVAEAVQCMTKVAGESYEEYIAKVKSNPVSLKVKKADTICNLIESVKAGSIKRVKKYTNQLVLLTEK